MLLRTFIVFCFLCSSAWAAARNSPPWADPVLPPSHPAVLPEAPHRFLDWRNKVNLTILGALIAGDGITTQRNLANHAHELNPLARPLVEHGWAGQLAASALGYGSALGLSYMFHRAGHHKLERLVLHIAIGGEVAMVTNNLVRSRTR